MEQQDLGQESARPIESFQIFATHRDVLGATVLFGDGLVALGAPIALRDHAPIAFLIGWSALVIATSYGWELVQRLYSRVESESGQIRDRWGWLSTVVWGALPWIVFDSIDNGTVAWVLVFVVGFGIMGDLMYESPMDAPSFDAMLLTYGGSYLLAFALHLQLLPAAAVGVTAVSMVVSSRIWLNVGEVLIERRQQIEAEARTDALTGQGNRVRAVEAVAELIAAGHPIINCAFIDVDDFKHLNDNHGYAAGDEVLRAIGTAIRNHLPPSWTVARFGGDEFVAVGPGKADLNALIDVSLLIPAQQPIEIAQSLSIGTTSLPAADLSAERLFREAGSALRHAKRLGKHQVLEYTEQLRMAERSRLTHAGLVEAALDAGEIRPWAQLIVDLDTGHPVGMELLARWQQPDGTVVPPDEFIPVIEEQGRGPILGLQMITHAIETLADPEVAANGAFVSINLSARHLYHRRLPAEVLGLLSAHHVPPGRLVLEITESQQLPSSPIWRETAERLRNLGIGLAMDDLGAGYSSVEQLLAVPFSHLKVDRVLTQALDRPGTAQLAAGFRAMADGAGMLVIAEGVETREQVDAMRHAGFEWGQGFFFHRPEPLPDATAHMLAAQGASRTTASTDQRPRS